MLNDPSILVIDESTVGLDPEERIKNKKFDIFLFNRKNHRVLDTYH